MTLYHYCKNDVLISLLKNREIWLSEASEDAVFRILDKLEHVVPVLKTTGIRVTAPPATAAALPIPPASNLDDAPAANALEPEHIAGGKRKTKVKGKATGKGTLADFQRVNLNLTEDQERDLHAFYASKQPKKQPEMIAVVMFKLSELLGRKTFTYDEIYTGLDICRQRPLPKNIGGVVSNMVIDQWASREGGNITLKFHAEDHVKSFLPKQVAEAAD